VSVLIVPRGQHADYYKFLGVTARINGDVLVVDRRGIERRQAERRQMPRPTPESRRLTDRRGPEPATWQRYGLIVVRDEATDTR
jgi:hypothetical protein